MRCKKCGQNKKDIDGYTIHYGSLTAVENHSELCTISRYRILGEEDVPLCRQCITEEHVREQEENDRIKEEDRSKMRLIKIGWFLSGATLLLGPFYLGETAFSIGFLFIITTLLSYVATLLATKGSAYSNWPLPYSYSDIDGERGKDVGYKIALSLQKEYIQKKCGRENITFWSDKEYARLEKE